MEIIRDKDFKNFIENVRRGYDWIYELHCMLTSEEDQDKNIWDTRGDKNDENSIQRRHNLIIMDEGGQPLYSPYTFEELEHSEDLAFEKSIFKKIFHKDPTTHSYYVKCGFSHGIGFYSLAQELLSVLNVFHKSIFIDQPLSKLNYLTDFEELSFNSAMKHFLVNFSVAILYLSYFNILLFITSLESCEGEYRRGERLMSVNLQENIDIKKLLQITDLYDLLFYFDLYNNRQASFKLEEGFCKIKDKLHSYCEIFQYIEENIHGLLDQNVNPSYLQFILCRYSLIFIILKVWDFSILTLKKLIKLRKIQKTQSLISRFTWTDILRVYYSFIISNSQKL